MMSSSQTNKCLNEKRRRDQENVYIEELAELINERLADMNSLSVKPDKCAILQETVKQIRIIKQESDGNDLQASEVSSSKPNLIASDILGPLLLEALDGFLLVINQKGIIEFVSENVSLYLEIKQNKLISKPIFDLVHKDDHLNFRSLLRDEWSELTTKKTSSNDSQSANFGASANCNLTATSSNKIDDHRSRSKVFNARFKVKRKQQQDNDDKDDLEELDQDELIDYLNLQISARLSVLPADDTNSSSSSTSSANQTSLYKIQKSALVCVARRLPLNDCESSFPVEQFSSELDLDGKVLDVDSTGLNDALKSCVQKMLGKYLNNIVSGNQMDGMNNYLDEVRRSETPVVSEKFNLCLLNDGELIVKMKSKKNNSCIITTHSIIKPIQCNEQPTSDFKSSLSINNPIQVQQVQLKQTLTTNKAPIQVINSSSINLSPQTSTTSTLYSSSSNFEFQQTPSGITSSRPLSSNQQDSLSNISSTLVPSAPLVPSFVTSTITNPGSLLTSSNNSSIENSNNNRHKTVSSDSSKNDSEPPPQLQSQTNIGDNSIDMLNDCLSISDLFPSSSLLDYDNLNATNSTENTSHNIDFNVQDFGVQSQDDAQMSEQLGCSSQTDKLRNLLQHQDSSDQSDSSFSKQMSNLTTNMSKMDACHQPTTLAFSMNGPSKNADLNKQDSINSDNEMNSGPKPNNPLLNEILNQEDDFRMSTSRPSSSMSNNNDLESLFEKCNTIKPTTPNYQQNKSPTINSPVNRMSADGTKSKGNNMLRKLLNDDDLNKGFNNSGSSGRKSKDGLIQQLLRENSQPGLSQTSGKLLSPIDQNSNNSNSNGSFGLSDHQQQGTPASKFGPMKRKSSEDHHFSNINTTNQSNCYLNTSNNSCFSNSQPGTPNQIDQQTIEGTYPSAKRLSLSESLSSRPSSTPIPVTSAQNRNQNTQVRYSTSSNSIGQQSMQMNQSVNSPLSNVNTQQRSLNSPVNQQLQMNYTISQPSATIYNNSNNSTQLQTNAQQQQNLLIINSSNMKPNNPTNQTSPNHNSASNNQVQSQQLAGQNPMLALMLAQTPKTPVPSIPIPTNQQRSKIDIDSIVSQVPQERLPKNLEKKLVYTPTSMNAQYSNQLGQPYDNEQYHNIMMTSQINPQTNKQQMYSCNQQSQQYYLNNNRTSSSNLQSQQMNKPVQIQLLSGQFIQSSDQQQTPLSTTHLLNSQPVQPTSLLQVSGNSSQYLVNSNNKVTGKTGVLQNQNEAKTSSASSTNQHSTNSSFVMNSNQQPIMNVQQTRNQPQLSTSSCSFYSERITSSTSNNNSEPNSVAISSSSNVTSSSMMINNMNACLPSSSSIDSTDLNRLNNNSSMSNVPLISSTVVGSSGGCSPASNSDDTMLLEEILDQLADSTPANDTNSPNSISSTTFHQRSNVSNVDGSSPRDLNEKLAISAIQKQLMSFDNSINSSNSSLGIPHQTNSIGNQLLSNDANLMNYGPPTYQATTSNMLGNRVQNTSMINSQTNSVSVDQGNTMMTNSMNNNNQLVNRTQISGQGGVTMNSNFLQQQQQQSNNGLMGNQMNNQMMHNQIPQSGHMIHQINTGSSSNQHMNVQQQLQKNSAMDNRKQKMQFAQQPLQTKRFVGANQNASIQFQHSQSNFNPQQSSNSPQAQQPAKGPKQTLSPVQRPKLNQSGVILSVNQSQQSQSNTPFTTSYPSPSSVQQSSSPHLQAHRNMSSPHTCSPSSPNSTPSSTIHHQQPKSQPLTMNVGQQQNMNQASNIQTSNNWSNLPPNNMNNSNMNNMRTSTSAVGSIVNSPNGNMVNVTSTITLKRMQEQNPILNAQLSQDSVSYVQIHSQHSQNQPQQTLPQPTSNSPLNLNSGGISMRFNHNRNSPVLASSSQQQQLNSNGNQSQPNQQQYASPPNHHFMNNNNNVPSPTSQIQQQLNRGNVNANLNQPQQRLQHSPIQNRSMSSGQTYYPVAENIVSSNPMSMQQQAGGQQQVVYGNCAMNNNVSTSNALANNISSASVKQGLRAKVLVGARSHQQMNSQQPIQQRSHLMQQNQSQHLQSHTHLQSNSTSSAANSIQHLQMQQPASQSYSSSSQQLNSQSMNNSSQQLSQGSPQQLNSSSLTDEDFDAIGLGLSLNNDSSFFNFNDDDLPETNTMDLDLGGINSFIGTSSNNATDSSMTNAQSSQKGSLLQKLLSEKIEN